MSDSSETQGHSAWKKMLPPDPIKERDKKIAMLVAQRENLLVGIDSIRSDLLAARDEVWTGNKDAYLDRAITTANQTLVDFWGDGK